MGLRPDTDGCAASHATLVDHLRSVGDLDPRRPSRLEGWTVGHVLTHVARNADSYRSLLAGRPQYEGGMDQRNGDIEAGADRSAAALIDDVATASSLLDAAFAAVDDWDRSVPMMTGSPPARFLPTARRREVEVHRVDLDIGYRFTDVPDDFVAADLAVLRRWWRAANEGAADLPDPIGAVPARDRWLWLLGRVDVDGVGPAGLF